MQIKDDWYTRLLQGVAYTVIILGSLACLIPFLLIISASLTANESIIKDGYHFIPAQFSLEGYKTVFTFPDEVLRAYGVTLFTTVTGTTLGLFFMTMAGYVLARKDFKYRNTFSFYHLLHDPVRRGAGSLVHYDYQVSASDRFLWGADFPGADDAVPDYSDEEFHPLGGAGGAVRIGQD